MIIDVAFEDLCVCARARARVCVCVCASSLLFLTFEKLITFQKTSSNIFATITGLVCSGLYWRFEISFLYRCMYLRACVYICMYVCVYVCRVWFQALT